MVINILLAFVTGLTTGGLSCLAVQGGLLASSLAGQIEQDVRKPIQARRRRKPKRQPERSSMVTPITAFLLAKLLAYTILGFFLGWLGQMVQLAPIPRAILQAAIGIFMLGTALRMLNVHPIFRYFAIEPPAFIRRSLRQAAKEGDPDSLASPVFLGLLTVLIPCGITQAMMAAALATGSPLEGAVLMFSFTLGTSPVFFAMAYFATRLGSRLEKHFMRFAAVVILILGIFTIDSGITLAGSPVSLTRLVNSALPRVEASSSPLWPALQAYQPLVTQGNPVIEPDLPDGAYVTINVQNTGYKPETVRAPAGEPVTLRLVTQGVYSCSLAFVIPALGVEEFLEPTGETRIEIPAQSAGTRIPFSCSMGMYTGVIVFES